MFPSDINTCNFFGKLSEGNDTFFEFLICRNLKWHGDSNQNEHSKPQQKNSVQHLPNLRVKRSDLKMFQ